MTFALTIQPILNALNTTCGNTVALAYLDDVTLLSPVANPGKLVAAPVNYQKHLDEVKGDSQIHAGNPGHTITIQSAGLFLKATSSLVGPGQGVAVRLADEQRGQASGVARGRISP